MALAVKDQLKPGENVRTASHGRGGAGNINARASSIVAADDLKTPTIKSQTYTTGRGGQGNMASNDSADMARAAQDVEAPAHHEKETKGTYHWGRGGEGNMMTVGPDDGSRTKSKERKGSKSAADGRRGSFQGVLDKGKEMLGMGKGKQGEKNGSAVVEEE